MTDNVYKEEKATRLDSMHVSLHNNTKSRLNYSIFNIIYYFMCITMCVSNILSCVGCVEVPDRCDMYNVCVCSMYTPVLVVFRFLIPNKLHMSKLIQLVVADNRIPLFSLFSAIGFLVISVNLYGCVL